MNRYLYADANPATLVDPDGHCAGADNWSGCLGNDYAGNTMSDAVYQALAPARKRAALLASMNGGDQMSNAVLSSKRQQFTADWWAASSQWAMGNAAWTAAHNKWVAGMTDDQSARNIASENASDYYWGKCNQEGDQAACDTLKTIHVDYGDAWGTVLAAYGDTQTGVDTVQEGSKDYAEHLIDKLPDGPVKTQLMRLLGAVDKLTSGLEMYQDASGAMGPNGDLNAGLKSVTIDTYKLGLTAGAAAACGFPEDGVGAICGVAGAWVADKTAPLVGWGVDTVASWVPHF